MRPVIVVSEPNKLDEVSSRILPISQRNMMRNVRKPALIDASRGHIVAKRQVTRHGYRILSSNFVRVRRLLPDSAPLKDWEVAPPTKACRGRTICAKPACSDDNDN